MSYRRSAAGIVITLMIIAVFGAQAKDAKNAPPSEKIPSGAKVFVAPITDGFDTFLRDAIGKKKVPVELVASRDQADYEITGAAESQKAGAAKKITFCNRHSREDARIKGGNSKSGTVGWACCV